jgi:hypothetical protein
VSPAKLFTSRHEFVLFSFISMSFYLPIFFSIFCPFLSISCVNHSSSPRPFLFLPFKFSYSCLFSICSLCHSHFLCYSFSPFFSSTLSLLFYLFSLPVSFPFAFFSIFYTILPTRRQRHQINYKFSPFSSSAMSHDSLFGACTYTYI